MTTRQAFALATVMGMSCAVHAAVVQIGNYGLGEAGTVGASAPFTPLSDSVGGPNNITSFQGTSPTAIVSTGLVAPGSIAALQISGNPGSHGWHSGAGYGLTDNWSFDIWVRPDSTGGTFLGSTDNDAANGLTMHAANNVTTGTSLGGKIVNTGAPHLLLRRGTGAFLGADTSVYSAGQWLRVSGIVLDNTVYYYLDTVLQDSATFTQHDLDNPMLGFGPGGIAGTNAAFDELRTWSFAASDTLRGVQIEMGLAPPLPEPSTLAMLGIGGLLLALQRKK